MKSTEISASKRLILYMILICMMFIGICFYCISLLPDRYFIFEGDESEQNINVFYPLTSQIITENGESELDIKLMGIVPIKKVKLEVLQSNSLIVGGEAFGIRLFTDGVLVIGLAPVNDKNPAFDAGLRPGDMITQADGQTGLSNEKFAEIIRKSEGRTIQLKIRRGGITADIEIQPIKDESGVYRAGCYVRDSTAGIGTITYIDPTTGKFAGLGHGIYDSDTGEIMSVGYGEAVGADIYSVKKGEEGRPGELQGIFNETRKIGSVYENYETGIFGNIYGSADRFEGKVYPIGKRNEVETGPAVIRSTIDGSGVKEFEIEIIRVYRSTLKTTKNMVIEVKDKELINQTGGIVQGMSGSPIIQNGKIIGAVTHVMVNDPLHGYAIFIENMLGE